MYIYIIYIITGRHSIGCCWLFLGWIFPLSPQVLIYCLGMPWVSTCLPAAQNAGWKLKESKRLGFREGLEAKIHQNQPDSSRIYIWSQGSPGHIGFLGSQDWLMARARSLPAWLAAIARRMRERERKRLISIMMMYRILYEYMWNYVDICIIYSNYIIYNI